jgi:P4 family phage/plasmid primase-like protien
MTPRQQTSAEPAQVDTAANALYAYMSQFRVYKGGQHTHTRMGACGYGSYYIPGSDAADFMRAYAAAVQANRSPISVTERHRHVGPVVVDLDFRFHHHGAAQGPRPPPPGPPPSSSPAPSSRPSPAPRAAAKPPPILLPPSSKPPQQKERSLLSRLPQAAPPRPAVPAAPAPPAPDQLFSTEHRYSRQNVADLVGVYAGCLARYLQVDRFHVFVHEKPGCTLAGEVVKDGLHLLAPELVTRPELQEVVRRAALSALEPILRGMQLANAPEDVVDAAVIHRNNWLMYGSCKPGGAPYALTRAFRWSRGQEDGQEEGIEVAELQVADALAAAGAPTLAQLHTRACDQDDEPDAEPAQKEAAAAGRRREAAARGGYCPTVQEEEAGDSEGEETEHPAEDANHPAEDADAGECTEADGGADEEEEEEEYPDRAPDPKALLPLAGAAVPPWDLYSFFSIRNKYVETPTRPEREAEVLAQAAAAEEAALRREAQQHVIQASPNPQQAVNAEGLEQAAQLVEMLGDDRANKYDQWIRLGWCLRNVDHRLLGVWEAFSRRSPKFAEGECARLWAHMRPGSLGIGTLHLWARADSPERYQEALRSRLADLLLVAGRTGSHYDVAVVVHSMFRHEYVCASYKSGKWFRFSEHRWQHCQTGVRARLSNDVFREFMALSVVYAQRSSAAATDDTECKRLLQVSSGLTKVAAQLKICRFKGDVAKECGELFFRPGFEELLDSRCELVGFKNGVYDLDRGEFREGRPDDYVSLSTEIDWVQYDPHHPSMVEVWEFFKKVLPSTAVRDYVLSVLARALNGHIREERFHVWTGSGSNGKSRCVELLDRAFGDYSCKFPVTLLTQKRAASNSASPELSRAKGRRFAVLQEPSEDERLNVGLMKELSGGDRVMARGLFQDPIEFKPQFKLLLLCNHLPNVPAQDAACWRRIRVVHFGSKFVANPSPQADNEFAIDASLCDRFDAWKAHFMALLLEYYAQLKKGGDLLEEPEEVLARTRDYQRDNDHITDYLDSSLRRAPGACVSSVEMFADFKDWLREEGIQNPTTLKRKQLQAAADVRLGPQRALVEGGQLGYHGWVVDRGVGGLGGPGGEGGEEQPAVHPGGGAWELRARTGTPEPTARADGAP